MSEQKAILPDGHVPESSEISGLVQRIKAAGKHRSPLVLAAVATTPVSSPAHCPTCISQRQQVAFNLMPLLRA